MNTLLAKQKAAIDPFVSHAIFVLSTMVAITNLLKTNLDCVYNVSPCFSMLP